MQGSGQAANWAIAAIASRPALPFLRNALIGIARCGIDPAIVSVGVQDSEAEDVGRVAEALGAKVVLLPAGGCPADDPAPDKFLEFGTAPFNRFMAHKYPLVRTLLNEGHQVVYADLDVAWLCDPLPYLERVLARYDCAVQSEAVAAFPPRLCAGFFAFAPRARSLEIIECQIGGLAANAAKNYPVCDQTLLNDVISAQPRFQEAVFALPEGLFPNGLLQHAVTARGGEKGIMESLLKPFIFHPNWTIGPANKRALLEQANAWFVG